MEHGGWGLTGEAILLGLLVAPSIAGAAIGVAALAAFLARTPLKLVLIDRWRHRRLPRTVLAERVAGVELFLVAVLGAVALFCATRAWWAPVLVAAPLVGVELWFDIRSRSRQLAPELCGATGMASVAAAIALSGGASATVSVGLWVVLAARSMASVPFARVQVKRIKGQPHHRRGAESAQAAAVAIAATGWGFGVVPGAALVTVAALAIFHLYSGRHRAPSVTALGVQQLSAGLALVLITAAAIRIS